MAQVVRHTIPNLEIGEYGLNYKFNLRQTFEGAQVADTV